MHVRRLLASGAVIGLLLAAAAPVAAHGSTASHPPKDARYTVTTLVTGPSPDTDLVNGWGLSRSPTSPWWVADNGTDLSTLYTADGTKLGLRVSIPDGAPTGTVFNPGNAAGDFNGDLFLFDGESGTIFGWRGALGTTAEVLNDDFAGSAVYKGLAIGTADVGSGAQQYLYATDFHNGRVDVFDRTGAAQTWTGAFTDPKLPKGYAPFGIQNLNGMVFVTYAKTQTGSDDEKAGRGRGFVDAFATNGTSWAASRAAASSTRRGVSPGHRPTSGGSAVICSSATSATATSTPTAGTASTGTPTERCGTRTATRSRSTACGRSRSVAGSTSPTTVRPTRCSSRPAPTTSRPVPSGP